MLHSKTCHVKSGVRVWQVLLYFQLGLVKIKLSECKWPSLTSDLLARSAPSPVVFFLFMDDLRDFATSCSGVPWLRQLDNRDYYC